MKKVIALIITSLLLIGGCQQNVEKVKEESEIPYVKQLTFGNISYNKIPEHMATTLNEKAKKLLENPNLEYGEYTKLEFAGETYLVKGSRRELSKKEYKEKYPNTPIPEAIGEYKIKTIVIGNILSSPLYSIANEEEKSQINNEKIEKEKYLIKTQPIPIMELLYENGESGLSIIMQNKTLLNPIKKEELASAYIYMALPELSAIESSLKESPENKNLKIAYNKDNQNYKSMAFYQEENSHNLFQITAGKLSPVQTYGVDYMALELRESSEIDPLLLETLTTIKELKLP